MCKKHLPIAALGVAALVAGACIVGKKLKARKIKQNNHSCPSCYSGQSSKNHINTNYGNKTPSFLRGKQSSNQYKNAKYSDSL